MVPMEEGPSGAQAPKTKSVSGSPRARSVSGSPRARSAAHGGSVRSAAPGENASCTTASLFAPPSPRTARPAGAAPASATSSGMGEMGSSEGAMGSSPGLHPSLLAPARAAALSRTASPLSAVLSLVAVLVALPALAHLAALASPHFLAPLLGLRTPPPGASVTPPVCQASHAPAIGGLPVLVFVAGVSGAGHELLGSFFRLLQDRMNLTLEGYDPEVHLTAEEGQVADSTKAARQTSRCPKLPYSRQVYDFGAEITSRLASLQDAPGIPFRGVYVRAHDTIPMGGVLTPTARPDLVALSMFHGIIYRLKVVVLVRAPSEILQARVRNGSYGHDPGLLFRVTEDSLAYLDAGVRQLPCGSYCALNMDTLLDPSGAPGQLAAATELADFLGFQGVGPGETLALLSQSRGVLLRPGEEGARGGGHGGRGKGGGEAGGGRRADRGQRRLLAGKVGVGRTRAGEGNVGEEGETGRSTGSPSSLQRGEEEEVKKWVKDLGDESSPRHLMWPLYTALASLPAFRPSYPTAWPLP